MSADKPAAPPFAEFDESAVSRAELHIEREKIEIERERLALERERLSAERERWKSDTELRLRAEGRGITVSTLVFVGCICVLAGVIAGFVSAGVRVSRPPAAGLAAWMQGSTTNGAARGGNSILLRPVDMGGNGKAYLLILE